MLLLLQLTFQVCAWNAKPKIEDTCSIFCNFFTEAMQILHYEEATLARAGINNLGSDSDVTNLAQAHTKIQTLLLKHQAYLFAMEKTLAFSLCLGKIGHISSRTRVVDAGVGKCSFLVVQGLHSISKEGARVGPSVLNYRLFVPSADL